MSSVTETDHAGFASDLRFRLNGRDVVIDEVDPTVLLLDWLRSPSVGLTGTKKVCAQGGCGACTVMLSRWDEPEETSEYLAINSCLRPLCSLDGMEITTTEGTGSCRSTLSAVQYRIAKENGSQCGFCTPGFVMNMHAFLASNEDQVISQKEIEDLFDGNLCRCTGYRSILYGMKHFASDWGPDDEEGCLRTVVDPAERVPHAKKVEASFPKSLKRPPRAVHYVKDGYHWYRPTTLDQVHAILSQHQDNADVKLVGGNTSIGIYDRFVENPHVLIDISQLEPLLGIEVSEDGLSFGAAVTYNDLLSELERLLSESSAEQRVGVEALRYMARRTAGTIVRNAATIAGNTMLVVRHIAEGEPFPSDMFTALSSFDTTVTVSLADGQSLQLPILEFALQYQDSTELQAGVLVRYHVPWTKTNEHARTYKTALREENAHSIVNAGLRVSFDDSGSVDRATIVLGGIGPVAFHAESAEQFLIGRTWNTETLKQALIHVQEDVAANLENNRQRMSGLPYEGFTEEYRMHLAESYFYQFFIYVGEQRNPGSIPAQLRSAGERPVRPVTKGKQSYEKYKDEYPVNLPIVKLGAFLQASGEACYTHDIAVPERTLEAAVVTSSKALAAISYRIPDGGSNSPADLDGLVAYLKERYAGFHDYVTARDIPKGGSQSPTDPFLALDQVDYFGQCIGLVLANNEQLAIEIAEFVSTQCIEYTPVKTPIILTIRDAIKKKSIFKDVQPYPVHIWKIERPGSDISWTKKDQADIDGIPCRVVRGTQQSGSQIHFYMETQACVAVPGERDDMTIYPSSQSPDSVQSNVRGVLGVPATRIDVKINRVGGGYGGKTTRSPYVASPVAVAAWKHHQPVKLAMRRENDSAMIGHRHPLFSKYALAIADTTDSDQKGRILGISTHFIADGGATYDCSFVVMDCIQLRCDSAYMVPNYQTSGDVCRTNKASNGAMRSMGLIQGMLAQEDAIEMAAHSIGMLPEDVRSKNLYQQGQLTPFGQVVDYCYLEEVWKRTAKLSDFDRRRELVEEFNQQNRWRKRGISMIPVKYASGYNATFLEQAGALVEVFGEDASVLVRHGGVEMGQGLLTKVAQIAALEMNLPLAFIETSVLDTQVVPNPISTGASTGTAFNGGAVQEACRVLRKRLEDYCLELLHQHGSVWCQQQGVNFWDYPEGWSHTVFVDKKPTLPIWLSIVKKADADRINLSSQVRFVQQGGEAIDSGLIFKPKISEVVNHFIGFTFSAACTEVEIDVLTGETTVLRADIVYDMGKSLNPAIDIGQVEGAYVQGLGYVLTEDVVFQPDGPNAGALNADNTWRYKVPATTTIPIEFNVDLFPRSDAPEVPENPYDLLSSKEVGEPPLVLAITAYFALKHAILAARQDRGHSEWFCLDAPATVQRVREACLVDINDLTF